MQLLAEGLRKRWLPATAAAFNEDFRGYQNDVMLARTGWRGSVSRFLFFLWSLSHYQVFHFFWGVSLLSWWRFHLLDLPILKAFGKKIIVHFRGLDIIDIRHFDYLRARSRGENLVKPPLSRPDQLHKVKKWLRYADAVLVSEPDLFDVVPNATLSPQVIDCAYWSTNMRPLSESDGVFRIVHAPSSRRKKGTDFIEQAVRNLQGKGYKIQLLLAEKLPHHRIREMYEQADVGIDQVLYGWHGKVSVELMALGKPVICNINEAWRNHRPDLPIVHADPAILEEVLERLIPDAPRRLELGTAGRQYAMRYHDLDVVLNQLLEIFGSSDKTKVKEKIDDAQTW